MLISKVICVDQDGTDSEVPVVDTTAVDNTTEPLDEFTAIVEQFIGCITGDQSAPANTIVQHLLTESDNELRYKPNYYIMMGNAFKLGFDIEKKLSLMDFIDELTGTVRHDFESQYDFKWIFMMFTMARELIRIVPSYRE